MSPTDPTPRRERGRSLVQEVLGLQLAIAAIGGLIAVAGLAWTSGAVVRDNLAALGRAVGVGAERARRAVLLERRRRGDARRRTLHRQVSRDRERQLVRHRRPCVAIPRRRRYDRELRALRSMPRRPRRSRRAPAWTRPTCSRRTFRRASGIDCRDRFGRSRSPTTRCSAPIPRPPTPRYSCSASSA